MNKFDLVRQELAEVEATIRESGETPETRARLDKLFANASVVFVFGPHKARIRGDDSDGRQLPDALDFSYYREELSLNDIPSLFRPLNLGEVEVKLDEVRQDDMRFPAYRVFWKDRQGFLLAQGPEFNASISAYHGIFEVLLGCEWVRSRIEVV